MTAQNKKKAATKKTVTKKAALKPARNEDPYLKLCRPLPRGSGRMQHCINRFNEVFGLNKWGFSHKLINEKTYKIRGVSHGSAVDVTVAVGIWIVDKENVRIATGGAQSAAFHVSLDQAIQEAFLKASALWGVGKEYFESAISKAPVKIQPESFEPEEEPEEQEELFDEEAEVEQPVIKKPSSKAKKQSQAMAEEDGAPPSASSAQRPKDPLQPSHPNPMGPITEMQKQKIAQLTQQAGRSLDEFRKFLDSKPNQAKAAAVIDALKRTINERVMGQSPLA